MSESVQLHPMTDAEHRSRASQRAQARRHGLPEPVFDFHGNRIAQMPPLPDPPDTEPVLPFVDDDEHDHAPIVAGETCGLCGEGTLVADVCQACGARRIAVPSEVLDAIGGSAFTAEEEAQ